MAAYLEKLTADMKAAMRAGEKDKLTVVRMLISDIKKKAEAEGELSDDAEAAILHRSVKMRSDTIDQAKAAGRDEIVQTEQVEIEWVKAYLPQQMTAEEVEAKVKEIAAAIDFQGGKDIGRFMKEWMSKYKGLADGKLVQQALRGLG
ncbi:MAG TPA: GatB/YqeY domain-containing protein [Planctomycetes bacterium]|nr:GatB/YqeY domain-containing protein [Planctomycetota bacterium]